jgi:NAD-dependent dihydropyrimidine dehydrogenase PreA subunit
MGISRPETIFWGRCNDLLCLTGNSIIGFSPSHNEVISMTEKTALDVPFMEVNGELCKGCQLCLAVCPKSVIAISDKLNSASYHPAFYIGADCTGCGLCFYACPEPGAIRVVKP